MKLKKVLFSKSNLEKTSESDKSPYIQNKQEKKNIPVHFDVCRGFFDFRICHFFQFIKGDERKMNQHVKVTFDFTNYNYGTYDLAVPAYLPIKNLIALVLDSLDISIFDVNTQIKVMTKGQLLVENDRLIDYQIADGDILKLL